MDLSSYSVQALTRRRPLTPVASRSSYGSLLSSTRSRDEGSPSNSAASSPNPALKRSLGLVDVIFYGVGCSVGAGIYSLVGIGADLAGPSIALSFLLCGTACCFTSLAYAEFAARVPLAGSAYTFTYVSFGELSAWLVGWNLTLGYAISSAVVAQSWAQYVAGFVQGFWSSSSSSVEYYLTLWTKLPLSLPWLGLDDGYTCCPLSVVIIGLCTVILVTGVKESTRFNTAMTVLNLSILLFVLMAGIGSGSVRPTQNLLPFFPHGLEGMASGAGLVFFSYLGFDMVACLSEECENPNKNMPRGIIGSLVITMTIYVGVSLVVVGMTPIALLGADTPITNALLANACCHAHEQMQDNAEQVCLSYTSCQQQDAILHPLLYVGSQFISFGAIFGLTTATFACLMGQPRINYAAAQDGLLFPIFAKVHPCTGVPTVGTLLTGLLTAIVACFVDLEVLANAISLGTLQVFSFINAGVIVLRMRGATVYQDDDSSDDSSGERSSLLANKVSMDDSRHRNSITESSETEHLARSLGLIFNTSSREIRKMVKESERASFSMYAQTSRSTNESSTPTWLVVIFSVFSILASLGVTNGWHMYFIVGCLVLAVLSAVLLFLQPKSPPPETFTCPFVPAVPLLGILCNAYMMGALPISTWWVILTWLLVGLVFYLAYGIHHSELKKRPSHAEGLVANNNDNNTDFMT